MLHSVEATGRIFVHFLQFPFFSYHNPHQNFGRDNFWFDLLNFQGSWSRDTIPNPSPRFPRLSAATRVLLISDVYFPRINGVSTSIQTFLRALDKKDEACLIAPDYGVPWDDEAHHVIRVPSYPTPGPHEDRVMYGKEIQNLLPQLRKGVFDVVHIHTFGIAFYEGVKIARKLNVPVISTYHTHFEEYLQHYISFWPFWLSKFLSRKLAVWQCNTLDAVVVPSQAMTETLRQNGVNAPMYVVPTGLDLSRFRDGDGSYFREKHEIVPDRQVLLFVGRVAPEKNVEFLIRMLSKVVLHFPRILLVIAGDGQAMNRCRELTCFLGLSSNVLFVGWLDRDTELLDCYDASNIFVFASRTETQGLALLEAMAMGVPVISISHLGSADTLKAQRGAIVAPDDEA